jgi:hypothetical protein
LPFSITQFAPAGVDSCAAVKAGIAAEDFDELPDALTTETNATESTVPERRTCTSLFKV